MSAYQRNREVMSNLRAAGVDATPQDAAVLCRAQCTLRTWAEQECGDSNTHCSWAIERETVYATGDGRTFSTLGEAKGHVSRLAVIVAIEERPGRPYRVTHSHHSPSGGYRELIADREAGALRRVAEVCKRLGLSFYHQSDPRGCALYVAREPLTAENYSRGIACC